MTTNTFRTVLLLTVLTVFFIGVGGLIAGRGGMMIAFVIALGMNFFSYWFSDKLVLKLYRAQPVSESEAPQLHRIVRNLIQKAKMPMPKVYIMNTANPNAFATGRNPENAAVAVTTGLMNMLDEDELEGVIAHELAHIHGRDILIGSIAATIAGAVMLLADWARWALIFGGSNDEESPVGTFGTIVAMILAPIAAMLIQMAISRSREYQADERGAKLSGKPEALASALQKISNGAHANPIEKGSTASAHMFIVNPFSGRSMLKLFSTHPPVEKRVEKLMQLSRRR